MPLHMQKTDKQQGGIVLVEKKHFGDLVSISYKVKVHRFCMRVK